jgi:phosphate transport system permease protein
MDRPTENNSISLVANKQLKRRHGKARAFAVTCWIATWVGVVMLAILLCDVAGDSFGWVLQRTANDPRMFMLLCQQQPGFEAQAHEIDPALFEKIDHKIDARTRSAERRGDELNPQDRIDIRTDVLHSVCTDTPDYYKQFHMQSTFSQRVLVSWQITRGILWDFASRHPTKAGYKSAIVGSLWLLVLTALLSVPVGVSAAVYMEEYAKKNRLNRLIEVNISNLAGVPSIVYGILGLAVFVRGMNIEGWGMGNSVLAGSLTMGLLSLPVIIIAAREAIKAAPDSIRQGAFALGATKWQVVRHHVLPAALPGMLTGVILAMSRAIGETAPMIMIGALSYVAFIPKGPLDDFTVLPIQIYNWIAMPQKEYHLLAACGILVLLVVLLLMNSVAIVIRDHAQRKLKW